MVTMETLNVVNVYKHKTIRKKQIKK